MFWLRRLAVLAFLLCAVPGWAGTPTLIQQTQAQNGGLSQTQAATNFSPATTVGNYIVIATGWCASVTCLALSDSETVTGITNTAGDTFTKCVAVSGAQFQHAEIWYAKVGSSNAGGATVTVSGASAYYLTVFASEWSHIKSTSPCDAVGEATGTSTTASVSTSGATSESGELVYAFVFFGDSGITSASPYTQIQKLSGQVDEYKIGSSATTETATFAQTSHTFLSLITTFLSDGGGGGATCNGGLMLLGVGGC